LERAADQRPKNAYDDLSRPNAVCVGSSWVAPDETVKASTARIETLAREAAGLMKR
jgi:2-keto-3-deoxy-6-phosphogluconate aldolase